MSKCKKPFTIRLLSLQKHSLFSLNMKRPTVRPGMCSFGLQKNPRKKKKKKRLLHLLANVHAMRKLNE